MSTPDPTTAAKQAASAFHTPSSLSLFHTSLLMRLQKTRETVFGGNVEPSENLRANPAPRLAEKLQMMAGRMVVPWLSRNHR